MDNCLLYDWYSITIKILDDTPEYILDGSFLIDLLGLQKVSFETSDGVKGYSKRLWYDGINIHLPSEKQKTVWLEMSGSGCRAFETYGNGDWISLFKWSIENANIKRIDIAFDDHNSILDIQQLVEDTYFKHEFVSKSSYHECVLSFNDKTGENGTTIQHGSPQSEVLIRIYDKAAQLHIQNEHWVRCELQLRNDRAQTFIEKLITKYPIGQLYSGVIANYLRYVDENENDSNMWRWSIKDYWAHFLGQIQPIQLAEKKDIFYNLDRLENYVMHQAGNAIRCAIDILGEDEFLKRIKQNRPNYIPDKYRLLVEQVKRYEST